MKGIKSSISIVLTMVMIVSMFSLIPYEANAATVTNTLTANDFTATSTSYTSTNGVTKSSGAVYAGKTAKNYGAIQLNNTVTNGIVCTSSGGKAKKVTVTWNSNTTNGRTLNIYGSNTAYSSSFSLNGTAIGTIVKGSSTELVVEGDYQFIGMRSSSGAMYLDEIKIDWENDSSSSYTVTWKNYDGTVLDEESYAEGETPEYKGSSVPSKPSDAENNYTFSGWSPAISEVTQNITYTAQFTETPISSSSGNVDTLNNDLINLSGSSYTSWVDKSDQTNAIYSGKTSAGNKNIIQMKTDGSDCGIVSTQSGGMVTKIEVTWNSSTAGSGKLQVYGKNSAYSLASDLYKDSKKGVLIGTIVRGTSTVLNVTDEYRFIGLRSETGAIYIDEIKITWASKPTHKVTWNNDDGSEIKTENIEEDTDYTYTGTDPEKASTESYTYTFKGWKIPDDDTLYTNSAANFPHVTDDLTYTAYYEQSDRTFTVTWKNGDDTIETDSGLSYNATPEFNGSEPAKAATPKYTFTFDGWQSSADNQVYASDALPNVTDDVTYSAHFSETIREYTITWYNDDGTTVLKSDNVAYDETPEYGEAPTKSSSDNDYYYIFAGWTPSVTKVTGDASYTANFQLKSKYATTDTLTRETTEVANGSTTYTSWSGKTGASGAVYAGNSAGGYDSIQLRVSTNSQAKSGIVTTSSGGKVAKVEVTWNSNTPNERTLEIYGKTSAYNSAADLYNENNKGTLLGTIVNGTSAELTIDGDYTFIGLRSNNGAMYLEEINITWAPAVSTVTWKNGETVLETDTDLAFNSTPQYDGIEPSKAEDVQYIYTFDGWLSSVDGKVYATDNLPKVTCDVTYTAHFATTAKTYTVRWLDYDGTELASQSYEAYQTPVYPNGTPETYYDENYRHVFSGWSPSPTDVVADVDYTAQYSSELIVNYNVRWENYDGTLLDEREYPEGKKPQYYGELPARPDDNYRYVFTGWSPAISVLTSDATYTAHYIKIKKTNSILPIDSEAVYGVENTYYKYNDNAPALLGKDIAGFSVENSKLMLGDTVVADIIENDFSHLGTTVFIDGTGSEDDPYIFYPNYMYGKVLGDISGYHNNLGIDDYHPGDGFFGNARVRVGEGAKVTFMSDPTVSSATFNGYVGVGKNNYGYNYVNADAVAYEGHGPYEFDNTSVEGAHNYLYFIGANDDNAFVFSTVEPQHLGEFYRKIPAKEADIFEKGNIEHFVDDDGNLYRYSSGQFYSITKEKTLTTELINEKLTPDSLGDVIFGCNSELAEQYFGGRILGVNKKLADEEEVVEEDTGSLRFMTVLSSKILRKLYSDSSYDFGYVFVATSNDVNVNLDKVTVEKAGKHSCKNTANSISGEYGNVNFDSTEYKYITAGIDEVPKDTKLIARFYIRYKGETHYINYSKNNATGIVFNSSDVFNP